MNYLKLSWKNSISRPWSSLLSIILLGLGICLISLLLMVRDQLENTLNRNIKGIDMVLGAKGSPLQLILSAVFQIDAPTGNIKLSEANYVAKSPLVKMAIPLSYGDSYQGYRIVGTTAAYPQLYEAKVAQGELWDAPFEVTIGSNIAQLLNLNIGDTFQSQHGFDNDAATHDSHHFKVVGILQPSNSPLDQLILTGPESIWESHHHHEENDGHVHEEEQEITAMLVQFKSPMAKLQVPRMVNEQTKMQSAVPAYEVYRLVELMGVGIQLLNALAFCILFVSGLSVFINLYNALRERKYEMALLRNYGAPKWRLAQVILQESILLTIMGFTFGMIISRLALWGFNLTIAQSYGYQLHLILFKAEEAYLLGVAIAIGIIAALIPVIRVYTLEIAKILKQN